MEDQILECQDCGEMFPWTVGEQKFYKQKGFSQPKRCKSCREQKRIERENEDPHVRRQRAPTRS